MIHMNDPVQEVENPATEASETVAGFTPEDTAVVTDMSPTGMSELAWSTDGPDYTRQWSMHDTEPVWQYGEPNAKSRHSRLLWCVTLAAVLLTAVVVGWFGSVFYREESTPTAKPPTSSIPQPKPPTELINPPTQAAPPPAPTEEPHPAAQYSWVSLAISRNAAANGGLAVGAGFANAEADADQIALQYCRNFGDGECDVQATNRDGCVALVRGVNGLSTATGATRTDAIVAARAANSSPGDVTSQAYCSWDGPKTT